MGRFVIFFSYLGTKYRGLQIQNAVKNGTVIPTVQGALHETLSKLQPANKYKLFVSSRTDVGVHALRNACHVDLRHPVEGQEYDPEVITSVMNYHLKQQDEEIRILETRRVPAHFHCRLMAQGRKYVYRLAYLVGEDPEQNINFVNKLKEFKYLKNNRPCLPYAETTSILELNKLTYIWKPLDVEKLILAAQTISGIHNYGSFTVNRKVDSDYQPHPVKMLTIGVKRGHPLAFPLLGQNYKANENLEFWDIHVRSKSFLYKQVRRVVGAMVLLASNQINVSDLQDILDNPRKDFQFSGSMGMPDHGLYLVEVEYKPEDLEYTARLPDSTTKSLIESVPLTPSLDESEADEDLSLENECADNGR